MKAFTKHRGLVAALDRIHVDTDQIIPKQFLKRIERTGYGQFLFYDWRFRRDGSLNPEFELNAARYHGASILLAGANFGCGSSREHAAWALQDYGFRTILASSFSDIFQNNCFKNGILPVQLPEDHMRELFARTEASPGYHLTVDLHSQTVRDDSGLEIGFGIQPFERECLLHGLDEIGLTLRYEDRITAYERRTFYE
jgi:3-isopropylmalate/(R)-2-methylmalate dehydratase small subunit